MQLVGFDEPQKLGGIRWCVFCVGTAYSPEQMLRSGWLWEKQAGSGAFWEQFRIEEREIIWLFLSPKQGEPCEDVPVLLTEKARSCVSKGSLKHRSNGILALRLEARAFPFCLPFSTCCNTINFTPFFK